MKMKNKKIHLVFLIFKPNSDTLPAWVPQPEIFLTVIKESFKSLGCMFFYRYGPNIDGHFVASYRKIQLIKFIAKLFRGQIVL